MFVALHMFNKYRIYRIRNRRSTLTDSELIPIFQLKHRLDGLYSTLEAFNGTVTVLVLNILATLSESFYAFGASEVSVVRTLTYYLEEEVKEVNEVQISDVDDEFDGSAQPMHSRFIWPFVLDAQILRFPTDYLLHISHDYVACAMQKPVELEVKFSDLLSNSAHLCLVIFPKSDFVNYYVLELKQALRYQNTQNVHLMPSREHIVM